MMKENPCLSFMSLIKLKLIIQVFFHFFVFFVHLCIENRHLNLLGFIIDFMSLFIVVAHFHCYHGVVFTHSWQQVSKNSLYTACSTW